MSSETPRSSSRKVDNKFFKENAIKPLPLTRISSHSSQNLQTNNYNSARSLARTQSVAFNPKQKSQSQYTEYNSTGGFHGSGLGLNPKQFTHREVFNSKLYQADGKQGAGMKKYFKISLNRGEKQQANLGTDYEQYLGEISRVLHNNQFHENEQLKKIWKNVIHHVQLLEKVPCVPNSKPLKLYLQNTLTSLESFLLVLSSQLSRLEQFKKEQQQNLLNLKRKRQLVSEQQLKKMQQQRKHKLQNQITESNALHKYKNRINAMDFEIKKHVLRIEKLEEELGSTRNQVSKLRLENQMMQREREDIQKWRQDYEYKIKKLKEELEVAHIVKQQNLEDKFNYILGWKL